MFPVTTLIGSNVGDVVLQCFMNASEENIILSKDLLNICLLMRDLYFSNIYGVPLKEGKFDLRCTNVISTIEIPLYKSVPISTQGHHFLCNLINHLFESHM